MLCNLILKTKMKLIKFKHNKVSDLEGFLISVNSQSTVLGNGLNLVRLNFQKLLIEQVV